jgi:hypothetical protein
MTDRHETQGEAGIPLICKDFPDEPRMPEKYSPVRQERFPRGGLRSVARLSELRYDPIKELVNLYEKLRADNERYERWQRGDITPLDGNGNARRYSAQAHAAVREQMIRVGESLLRYGYGRVPETVNVESNAAPLVINLASRP